MTSIPDTASVTAAPAPWKRSQVALLIVLTLAYTIGYIDRQVLNLLVEPIRTDIGLTDVEISLLQGLSFSIGFLVFSPVFGRLAGRQNRRNMLLFAMIGWSIATTLMAFARTFPELFALRLAIGATEAAISPLAFSMIADAVDNKKMARAFSLFMLAPYLGGGGASLLGGVVYDYSGTVSASAGSALYGISAWQITFILIGVPSLATAAMLLIIREPRRPVVPADGEGVASKGFLAVARKRKGYYVPFFMGMALLQVPLYVYAAWLPTTGIRVAGASVSEIGALWGTASLLCGCAGTLCGPTVGNWLARRGWTDGGVRLPLIVVLCMIPCHVTIAATSDVRLLVAAGGLGCFFAAMPLSVASSGLRLVTPAGEFGMAAAVYSIGVMIAGIAVAPTLVALATQYLFGDPDSVGLAVATVCVTVSTCSALLLAKALLPFREALAEQSLQP